MPTSPFRDEAERLRAREAFLATVNTCSGHECDTLLTFAVNFDRLYPEVTDAPTPPDFDAALVVYGCHAALRRDDTTALAAARQRVRELYEAVALERDDLMAIVIGDRARKPSNPDLAEALRAAQQGEVFTVYEYRGENLVDVGGDYHPGDKVHVTKIEEGA